jgi:hypothetical protein
MQPFPELRQRLMAGETVQLATADLRPLVAESGRRWVALEMAICPARRLRPRAVWVANGELPVGAVMVRGAEAVLQQTLPIEGLAAPQLEQALAALAEVARALRAAAAKGGDSDAPYLYLFRSERDGDRDPRRR